MGPPPPVAATPVAATTIFARSAAAVFFMLWRHRLYRIRRSRADLPGPGAPSEGPMCCAESLNTLAIQKLCSAYNSRSSGNRRPVSAGSTCSAHWGPPAVTGGGYHDGLVHQ
jgi:hypothetical protein